VAGRAVKIFGVTPGRYHHHHHRQPLFTVGDVLVIVFLRGPALSISRRVLGSEVCGSRRFWANQGIPPRAG